MAQGDRQASARTIASTTETYNGDMMAMMAAEILAADPEAVVPDTYNGLKIAWLQLRLTSEDTSLPGLMAAFAEQQSAYNWSSVGAFNPAE